MLVKQISQTISYVMVTILTEWTIFAVFTLTTHKKMYKKMNSLQIEWRNDMIFYLFDDKHTCHEQSVYTF